MLPIVWMSNIGLLSEWLRWPWIVVYAVVTVVHLSHAIDTDCRQVWHSNHVVMAVGMGYMFLPTRLKAVSDEVWQITFIIIAATIVVWVLHLWATQRTIDFLWMISLFDVVAMIYMFAFPEAAIAPLTYLLVIYFILETIVWMGGVFDHTRQWGRLLPVLIHSRLYSRLIFHEPLVGSSSGRERMTLSAMAAGMAYMFIIMQSGM
ncbi:DUF5134 domain-containing protein [Halalkalicoccus jeotgali]|uniref:Uncharacterized protein n=3 Tax=Halalkalicoccus jeotgali TaxID=413810 RepID=D8JCG0_HALJB|nr:hypothetical protein HacjB3_18638 [Halalkalicoccus jeotgali B3]